MLNELETKKLLRLHDVLNKALGLVYETINKEGLAAPKWLNEAAQDVKQMYEEIWDRRDQINHEDKE